MLAPGPLDLSHCSMNALSHAHPRAFALTLFYLSYFFPKHLQGPSSCRSDPRSQVTSAGEAWLLKQCSTHSPRVTMYGFPEGTAPGSTIHSMSTRDLHIQAFHCSTACLGGCGFPDLCRERESTNSSAPSCLPASSPLLSTQAMPSISPLLSSVR